MDGDKGVVLAIPNSITQSIINDAASDSDIKGMVLRGGIVTVAGIAVYGLVRKYLIRDKK